MDYLNLCLGIDFGTTNSCLSVWYNNKNIIIPDIDGSNTIASVIEINDKNILPNIKYSVDN
jgi:molecular chaperone DnaK (HSP70)